MKKKILTSTIAVIVFSLIIMTSFYILISNYRYIEHSKKMLKQYNQIITYFLENNSDNVTKDIKGLAEISSVAEEDNLRITYINSDGKVLFDSYGKESSMENHANREEFIAAKKNGFGESVRFSATLGEETIYYSTLLKNGSVVRTSEIIDGRSLLKNTDIKYYTIALIISLILGIIIAIKITNSIINPIKDLQFIASRIAHGDFHKRVKIMTNDELGSLGESFNHMADQLEENMKELINNQSRLTAILKSMGSGVVAVDKYHRVIMLNPYVKRIFKIEGEEDDIKGEKIETLIEDDRVIKAIAEKADKIEIKIDKPLEKHIRIRTSELLEGTDAMGVVAVIEDITDYRRLENMRSEFVANVSHELKTPVTSIKGFAETLKYVEDDETRNKFLDIIDEESDRLTRLIQDILSLYDIERKEVKVEEKFEVNSIVDSVYILVENEAEKRHVKVNIENNSNCILVGNKDRFKQMILNLVDNAVKYSGDNSTVWLRLFEEEDNLVIEVEDNGIGMSKEHLTRVFERFYRIDKARSRETGGTGLGLAIVKHIVNSFEGNITLRSEVGKGSKFTIIIPKVLKEM